MIEAAGTEESWRDALALVRPGGTVLFFGGLERGASIAVDAYRLHYEELTLRGAFHHTPATVRAALVFLARGAYPWGRLITRRSWVFDGGADEIAVCAPDCEELYESYWKPAYGALDASDA